MGVSSVAFAPDGASILTDSLDRTAKQWDTDTGVILRTYTGHTSRVLDVGFSSDGSKILTGSYDDTTRLWWAASPQHRRR